MKKNELLKHGLDVVPKGAKERETYRMSFQTSNEIIKMIEDAVESKGKRGAIKESLDTWLQNFDNLLVGDAVYQMKKILDGSFEGSFSDAASRAKTDNEEGALMFSFFLLLKLSFKNVNVADELKFKNRVNKTYTLSYEAKKALESITKKLSIKNSDAFNLVTSTFCKYTFDIKQEKEKAIQEQAKAVWRVFEDFADAAEKALKELETIYEDKYEIFDTEIPLRDLAIESESDTDIEKAIGQLVRGVSEIEGAAGIVWQKLKDTNKNNEEDS